MWKVYVDSTRLTGPSLWWNMTDWVPVLNPPPSLCLQPCPVIWSLWTPVSSPIFNGERNRTCLLGSVLPA